MTKINFVSNIIYRLISVLMRIFRLSIGNFPIFKLVFFLLYRIITHCHRMNQIQYCFGSLTKTHFNLQWKIAHTTHSVRFYWMDWIACLNIKQWCEKKALERTNKKIITIHHEIGKSNAIARKKNLIASLKIDHNIV